MGIARIPPLVRSPSIGPFGVPGNENQALKGRGNKRSKYGEVTLVQSLHIFPGLSILETSHPLPPVPYLDGLLPSNSPSENQENRPQALTAQPSDIGPGPLHLHPKLSVPSLFIFLCCLF